MQRKIFRTKVTADASHTATLDARSYGHASLLREAIQSPLLRHTTEDEVAQVYSFLLSDAANLIRGQAINADGGDTPY